MDVDKLIRKKYNKDISKDHKVLGKLRCECERAKRALSNQHQVRVEIESLSDGTEFSEPLTKVRFENSTWTCSRRRWSSEESP